MADDRNDEPYASDVDRAVRMFGADRTRLMDIVQEAHRRLGCLDEAAILSIAECLGVHAVEIKDMVSFYAFLNREPKGRFHIRFSGTPVALMKGAGEVVKAFAEVTGAEVGNTSADGEFTLDWAADLGMADQEPSALINGGVVTELTPADAGPIIDALRRNRDKGNSLPLFPGADADGAELPQARVATNLVRSGPILFRGGECAAALATVLRLSPEEVIKEVTRSKLRGRGGAGFPTGLKWRLCRQSVAEKHYVVCNADEGEPGTFKDRVLLSLAPHLVFDGMTIAAHALGATQGVIYLRGEYAYLHDPLSQALKELRDVGRLGENICGVRGFNFDIRIQLGAGAYICGEESALIESLEGKRGSPRDRPPFPTDRGYLGQPTAVDNVETFACVARIMEHGAAFFASFGTTESTGVKLLSVSGDCPRPGVYELPFGVTVNELLDMVGAPEAKFVQVGGPSGQCIGPKDYGRRIAYEDLSTGGSIMVFGQNRDVVETALQFTRFFVEESCGWCTPCRVGTTILKQTLEKILHGRGTLSDIAFMEGFAGTVMRSSRCGLGQTAPNPILSTMRNFPEAYEALLKSDEFLPRFSLSETLRAAVEVQGRESLAAEE
jgi:[NiFe] hydrogenase diaphorase moiety large subunit